MGFEKILTVKKYDYYIDLAFKNATRKAKSMTIRKGSTAEKKKTRELAKILTVKNVLNDQLSSIVKSFPSFERDLTDFYKDLIKVTIGLGELRKSLGAVNWARKKVDEIFKKYNVKIKNTADINLMIKYRNGFYGRVNSVLKQIKSNFIFLEDARRELRTFPSIKSRLFTVAIAGFPNVGKSTLLNKLTGARPEVAVYPFTTKGLMMGSMKSDNEKIQLIDTPGALNRFNKMNYIEQQAWLALKHVADIIIYIFDLTEPFPLPAQEKLLEKIKELEKPILIYLSKTDILEKDKIDEFLKKYKKTFADSKKLKSEILKKAE